MKNNKFCSLGLNPILLQDGLLDEVVNVARKFKYRAILDKVMPSSYWNRAREEAAGNQNMIVMSNRTINVKEEL